MIDNEHLGKFIEKQWTTYGCNVRPRIGLRMRPSVFGSAGQARASFCLARAANILRH